MNGKDYRDRLHIKQKMMGNINILLIGVALIATIGIVTTTHVQAKVPSGCTGNPHDEDSGPTGNPHDPGENGNPHDSSRHHHGEPEGADSCPGAQ
jgi:hypothetical protein